MADGWIKLHRQSLDTPELQSLLAAALWPQMLMRAAHRAGKVTFRGLVVPVSRGMVLMSVNAEAKRWGVSRKVVRTTLARFAAAGMINMDRVGNKTGQPKGQPFSVITICNYSKYQDQCEARGQGKGQAGAKQGPTEQEGKEKTQSLIPTPESINPDSVADGGYGGSVVALRAPASLANGHLKEPRGTRLPEDWTPGEEGVAYAREYGFRDQRINEMFEAFRDHWLAAVGQRAVAMSWPRKWKTWVRREHERVREIARREEFWRERRH